MNNQAEKTNKKLSLPQKNLKLLLGVIEQIVKIRQSFKDNNPKTQNIANKLDSLLQQKLSDIEQINKQAETIISDINDLLTYFGKNKDVDDCLREEIAKLKALLVD